MRESLLHSMEVPEIVTLNGCRLSLLPSSSLALLLDPMVERDEGGESFLSCTCDKEFADP